MAACPCPVPGPPPCIPTSTILNFDSGEPRLQAEAIGPFSMQISTATAGSYSTNVDLEGAKQRVRNLYLRFYGIEIPASQHIVLGVGSSELIAATYRGIEAALARDVKVRNYWSPPYYTLHETLAGSTAGVDWQPQFADVDGAGDADLIVAVSPNNPDGRMVTEADARAVWGGVGKAGYLMLDHVYDFLQFTGLRESTNAWAWTFAPENAGLCLLASYTKFGSAGSRIGWLITGDATVAEAAQRYVNTTTLGVALIGLQASERVNAQPLTTFDALYRKLARRHEELRAQLERLFPTTPNLYPIPSPQYQPYAYVTVPESWWVDVLRVLVRNGVRFRDSDTRSRVMLMGTDAEWCSFMKRLQELPSTLRERASEAVEGLPVHTRVVLRFSPWAGAGAGAGAHWVVTKLTLVLATNAILTTDRLEVELPGGPVPAAGAEWGYDVSSLHGLWYFAWSVEAVVSGQSEAWTTEVVGFVRP